MSEFREALREIAEEIYNYGISDRLPQNLMQKASALLARGEPYQQPSVFEARVPPDSKWANFGEPAAAEKSQPVAYVPVHPRNGPLWASTIPSLDSDHPKSYELMPLYAAAAAEKAREPMHVAIIELHESNKRKAVMVPAGQSLDFDDGDITRRWLWPFLGNDHHLVEFLEIVSPPAAIDGGEKP